MPLDAGPVSEHSATGDAGQRQIPLLPQRVVLEPHGSLGAALRAAREGLGLAVEDIAQATRVRAAPLASKPKRSSIDSGPSYPPPTMSFGPLAVFVGNFEGGAWAGW